MIEASTLNSYPPDLVKDLKEMNQPEICQRCKRIEEDCYPNDGDDCTYFESVEWSAFAHTADGPMRLGNRSATHDNVNHPNHYTQGGIECIKAIEASMPPEGFQDYCKGNVLKYIWRFRQKNGVEDLKKARVYLDWMIESAEGAQNEQK